MELSALIKRIAAGDGSSLLGLYDATARNVFGFVLQATGDRSSAEEVLVEAYRQAGSRAARFDPDRESAIGWLLSIARTCSIDRRRLSRREPPKLDRIETETAATRPEEAGDRPAWLSHAQKQAREAIESLPAEQRAAVELAFYGGMSPGEVAAHLGQPRAAVKTRIRLGMTKLAEMLKSA